MSRYAQPSRHPVVSLADVMSEQMASKDVCDRFQEDQEDEELLLALYLSSIEAQTPHPSQNIENLTNNDNISSNSENDSEIVQNYDDDNNKNKNNNNNNNNNNSTSTNSSEAIPTEKPSTQIDDDFLIAQILQAEMDSEQSQNRPRQLAVEDSSEDSEAYEDDEEQFHGPRYMRTQLSSTGEIITKHHPARAGAKNAARLEATLTRLPTGNLSASSANSVSLPTPVFNALHAKTKKMTSLRLRNKNPREEQAVQEDVLDHRTRRDLQKLVNAGILSSIHGAISTGKEARVFLAYGEPENLEDNDDNNNDNDNDNPDDNYDDNPDDNLDDTVGNRPGSSSSGPQAYAVKVFKQAVHGYADRERYLVSKSAAGRRRGHDAHNSGRRRVVTVWAEKEFRNLTLLFQAGVRVPRPVRLRKQLVLMIFLGHPQLGFPAPRLKDAASSLSPSQMEEIYWDIVRQMRMMYQKAGLVHADLSEYNILWHDDLPWIIDVAQGVDRMHENALFFLRRDCVNVADFFGDGVDGALSPRQMFEFVTDCSLGEGVEMEEDPPMRNSRLRELAEENRQRTWTPEELAQDEVFLKSFIPKNLSEVVDPLLEIDTLREHRGEDSRVDVFHGSVTGLNTDLRLRGEKEEEDDADDSEPFDFVQTDDLSRI